jgi:hypothetical protein
MIDFKDNEFEVTTATNVEEAKKGTKSRFRLLHGKERHNAIQKTQEVQQICVKMLLINAEIEG